ncbi:hypothetical protein PFISCL1PPCAC_13182, partial [Pristionchus fissidentatus]
MMLRVLAVAAFAAVALADQSFEADFIAKIKQALASLDPAFVQKLQEIGTNMDLSRNQKVAQTNEAIKMLPADQQEKAKKFIAFGLDKEKEMIDLAKSLIPQFSAEAQAVLNKIVSTYENGADVPDKQLHENIMNIMNSASDAVKAEFKAAESSHSDKV